MILRSAIHLCFDSGMQRGKLVSADASPRRIIAIRTRSPHFDTKAAKDMSKASSIQGYVRWLMVGAVLCAGAVLFSGATKAGERQEQTPAPAVSDLDGFAVSPEELSVQRGTGLKAGSPAHPNTEDKYAVILWDEFKGPGSAKLAVPAALSNGVSISSN